MNDERLSEFGNERVRQVAAESVPDRRPLLDRVRYGVVTATTVVKGGAVLLLFVAAFLSVYALSAHYLWDLGLGIAMFLVAFVVERVLTRGWWWADD